MTKEFEMQLLAWQKNEDYTEGLRLWKQRYGENMAYRMLCLGSNDFNREKMRRGLAAGFDRAQPDNAKPKKIGKVARLEGTVEELDSELRDVSDTVYDVKDTVDNLASNVENLEGSMMDLAERVEAILAKVPDREVRQQPTAETRRRNTENEPEEITKWHISTYGLMDERVLLKQQLRDLPDPSRREKRKDVAYRILDITAELDKLFGMIGYWEQHGRVPSHEPLENTSILYPKRYLNLRTYVSRTRGKISKTTDPLVIAALEEKIKEYEREMANIEIEL